MFRNPTTDLIIVLVIILLIFGPKRLPGLGRSIGQGMREFKDSITGDKKDEEPAELTQASASEQPQPVPAPTPAAAVPPRESADVGSERHP
jgi:sec-independent protein translocase protein TatA